MQELVPFKPIPPTPEKVAALRDWAAKNGLDPDDVDKGFDDDARGDWFGNDKYVVIRQDIETPPGWPDMVWLSIRRQDRAPIHDWRDLQAIKSQLVGPECEGVELFPAESRVVDTANQYHLWVIKDPTQTFPFGFAHGLRADDAAGGAVQREGAGA